MSLSFRLPFTFFLYYFLPPFVPLFLVLVIFFFIFLFPSFLPFCIYSFFLLFSFFHLWPDLPPPPFPPPLHHLPTPSFLVLLCFLLCFIHLYSHVFRFTFFAPFTLFCWSFFWILNATLIDSLNIRFCVAFFFSCSFALPPLVMLFSQFVFPFSLSSCTLLSPRP